MMWQAWLVGGGLVALGFVFGRVTVVLQANGSILVERDRCAKLARKMGSQVHADNGLVKRERPEMFFDVLADDILSGKDDR